MQSDPLRRSAENSARGCRSAESRDALDDARRQTLAFFNAPPGAYHCIFTAGATASLKLVAESLAWTPGRSQFLYTVANHTCVIVGRHAVRDVI
jgi:selenocysteine lyase/cysteine desulfurase